MIQKSRVVDGRQERFVDDRIFSFKTVSFAIKGWLMFIRIGSLITIEIGFLMTVSSRFSLFEQEFCGDSDYFCHDRSGRELLLKCNCP